MMSQPARALEKIDRVATYLWEKLPIKLSARAPVLASHMADGRYISQVPVFNLLLPVLLLSFGIFAGVTERTGSFAYTANVPVLMMFLSIGILSRHLGIWALCGFILSDAFFYAYPAKISFAPLWTAQLISWMFLYYLCIGFPFLAQRLGELPGRFKKLSAPLVIFFTVVLTEFWTQLAMIVLRPLHMWLGRDDGLALVNFAEAHEWLVMGFHAHALTWVAFAAIVIRIILDQPLTRLLPSPPLTFLPPVPHQITWPMSALIKAGCFTLLMAGLFTEIWAALCFWLILSATIAARSLVSSINIIARWDILIARILPFIRVILIYALTFLIAYLLGDLLRDILGLRTLTVVASLLIISLTAGLMLWPPEQIVPFETLHVLLKWKRTATGLAVTFTMAAGTAFAHHCSFKPGCECLTDATALASLIASAGVFGIATGTILPGSYATTHGLMQNVEYKVSVTAYKPETGQSGKIVGQIKVVPNEDDTKPYDPYDPNNPDAIKPFYYETWLIGGLAGKGVIKFGKMGLQNARNFFASKNFKIDTKILSQMTKRGWTQKDIETTIKNPAKIQKTKDSRWKKDGSGKNNDPATAYFDRDGHYVVRNDKTGDVVQVTNKNKTHWKINLEGK